MYSFPGFISGNGIDYTDVVYELVDKGIIQRIGRGKYKLGKQKEFTPVISNENKSLYSTLKEEFPFLDISIWTTQWVAQWMLHIPGTYQTIIEVEKGSEEIANGNITEDDLEEAKMSFSQKLDSPIPPGTRAHIAFSWEKIGKTLKTRQDFRDRLFATTKKEVSEAFDSWIFSNFKKASLVSLSGKALLEKEKEKIDRSSFSPFTIEEI